eukprot:14039966-Alexandrium_andersonii.AAC.1
MNAAGAAEIAEGAPANAETSIAISPKQSPSSDSKAGAKRLGRSRCFGRGATVVKRCSSVPTGALRARL